MKTMFHTQLSIFLWALLFLIPGIYKQYQYRMVEYILAEHPDMPYKEAMKMSRDMMNGQKWNAFVLDLSFILWEMLGVLTCGLVHIFCGAVPLSDQCSTVPQTLFHTGRAVCITGCIIKNTKRSGKHGIQDIDRRR